MRVSHIELVEWSKAMIINVDGQQENNIIGKLTGAIVG